MVGSLWANGRVGISVIEAFRAVPRHAFLPGEPAARAYENAAIVIKSDADGFPVSASTQPALMAIMLEQLELSPGDRVLEIGTGSGYNAALIAQIVGNAGCVVTVDVDPDLVARARTWLVAAGFAGVTVVCGDGAAGVPDLGPYDRIIVTAGVWDLAPQWLAQLRGGGRIVAPVSVRGIQLAASFEHEGMSWVSRQVCRCQFIRMTGSSAGPEVAIPLGPQPGPRVLIADGSAPAADALYSALSGPATNAPILPELRVGSIEELADLDLWLALTEAGLSRLTMMRRHKGRASQAQRAIASLLPLGGFAECSSVSQLAVAALAEPYGLGQDGRPAEVMIRGWGPCGAALGGHLARRAAVWDELGRPGADTLNLAVYPAGTKPEVGEGCVAVRRPHTVLVARWPTTARLGEGGSELRHPN
jgi:protein-L-isoaspartate(D-aspartate) O-methyltransferase